jgi:hypothetical protein
MIQENIYIHLLLNFFENSNLASEITNRIILLLVFYPYVVTVIFFKNIKKSYLYVKR